MPLVVPSATLPTRKFGNGPEVTVIGYGAMSITSAYTPLESDEDALKILEAAVDLGIRHVDTANIYGGGHSEELIGQAIRKHGREKIGLLATKFGFVLEPGHGVTGFDGSRSGVRRAFSASLERLGVDSVDLLYAHRVDPNVPIEETVAAMAELVKEGKVNFLGLSECSAETLRRAHKVHPITAVQSELSLMHTNVLENGVLETCKELGVAFVAFSPLGRGFLGGKIRSADDFSAGDFRRAIPRFQPEHFSKNLALLDALEQIAASKGCSVGQLAIAWVLKRGDNVFVIPGTKRVEYLAENVGAAFVEITEEEEERLGKMLKEMPVSGDRYGDNIIGNLTE